ncbi:MAG TPA: carbamoyl-phosphate synthase large subunit [Actinomycetes bacterium]|nr:carbamoyl-phosphate synthase large subunit [Actinomycetes bacterium]
MPLRADLRSVLVIGSGPIVIGQAAEFDYSGTQACRALRRLGLRVVLVNSNPATIMTDPEVADATYLEPLTVERVTAVIAAERPDALLPTLGGQTGLNLAVALAEAGVLDQHGVELIGATVEAVRRAESRQAFVQVCRDAGLAVPRSVEVDSLAAGARAADRLGLPVVLRPSFTLGGWGGGVARSREDLERMLAAGLAASPVGRVLVEQSVLGWKEFELEVMRDRADNAVVVCSIENLDPMGVHTGDSITVAPAMTLSDVEYQAMRDDALTVLRAVGVETGGANVQFAVDPAGGRRVVIEMNPRVSRSSALASKATGFPIAKVAAQLAVGLTLDEIRNEVTGMTAAAFEPTLDYVVVKAPRFNFEKFPDADAVLSTSMKAVGEVMAIGRTFPEALQKAWRSLETGRDGLGDAPPPADAAELRERLATPTETRLEEVHHALAAGASVEEVAAASAVDPWFVDGVARIVEVRRELEAAGSLDRLDRRLLERAKRHGFSDAQLARVLGTQEIAVRAHRRALGVEPVYRSVDTCAGEFPATTPYHYSTYGEETEVRPTGRPRVVVLGSGPNRIGQGVEFDTVCVHAVQALRAAGIETVMVNCNPETVSTDYDLADRLYVEPLTLEDVLGVCRAEQAAGELLGVVVTLGGQTPLQLAQGLQAAGIPILGTAPEAIDLAEDRGRFGALLARCGLNAPEWGQAATVEEALEVAGRIGYPVLVRPSYVLGGRSMEVCYDAAALARSPALAGLGARPGPAGAARSTGGPASAQVPRTPGRPVLVDRFLEDAIEVDVDALADGREVLVCGVMEHIEEAGIHSGDSACALPPITLGADQITEIAAASERIAGELGVVGCLNIQFALRRDRLFVLEANPRASRSVPFVEKVTGLPVGKAAARIMVGATLAELRAEGLLPPARPGATPAAALLAPEPPYVGVKEAVLPFARFAGADALLGPEMRSTGEVLGLDRSFGPAFAKSQEAAYGALPTGGVAFLSVRNTDKRAIVLPARLLVDLGFKLVATSGTASVLARNGIPATVVPKVHEGPDNVVELLRAGQVDVVVNTPLGSGPRADGWEIRTAAVVADVPSVTTLSGLAATIQGIQARVEGGFTVRPLQTYHAELAAGPPAPEPADGPPAAGRAGP